jgi:hypothetical protein
MAAAGGASLLARELRVAAHVDEPQSWIVRRSRTRI